MATYDVDQIVCRRCEAVLDGGDSFCRCCGLSTAAGVQGPSESPWPRAADPRTASAPTQGRLNATAGRLGVLLMIFGVLGPLGLPLLWASPHFSRAWKVILTTIVIGLTLLIGGLVCYLAAKLLSALGQLSAFGSA